MTKKGSKPVLILKCCVKGCGAILGKNYKTFDGHPVCNDCLLQIEALGVEK